MSATKLTIASTAILAAAGTGTGLEGAEDCLLEASAEHERKLEDLLGQQEASAVPEPDSTPKESELAEAPAVRGTVSLLPVDHSVSQLVFEF